MDIQPWKGGTGQNLCASREKGESNLFNPSPWVPFMPKLHFDQQEERTAEKTSKSLKII